LESIKGYFYYKVWAILDQGKTDNQSSIIQGKYKGEDPEDLFNLALQELNLKKIKRGIPLT